MSSSPSNIRREGLCFLILIPLTFAAYWQVQQCQFVNFDDTLYVTENTQTQAGLTIEGIRWAFTTYYAANWHPLTWISLMLDGQVYGLNPGGYHRTNLLLHLLSTLLLFHFLNRATHAAGKSLFVAALFAVHPLHVESVAWVAERKDVLSGFFFMLALLAYLRYVENPGIRSYLWVFVASALGLMSKSMVVTLPCVLLLLDYWPLGRIKADGGGLRLRDKGGRMNCKALILEKIPFFALTALCSAITIVAQNRSGGMISLERIPLVFRTVNMPLAYVAYLFMTVYPTRLTVFYPYPEIFSILMIAGAVLLLVFITLLAVLAARRAPYVIVGWLWYLGMLVPVIGIIQTGTQAIADRYTYLPAIGLFIAVAWGASAIGARLRVPRAAAGLIATAIVLVMAVLTYQQVGYWHNSITLFSHAIQAVPNNSLAHYNLGCALLAENDDEEAAERFRTALLIDPEYDEAMSNLAFALSQLGKNDEAVELYNKALILKQSSHPDYRNTLAKFSLTLSKLSKHELDDAVKIIANSIALDPGSSAAHYNLGLAYAQQDKLDLATAEFREALRLDPNNTDVHFNLGLTFVRQDNFEQAIAEFSQVLRVNPKSLTTRNYLADAHTNFAIALATQASPASANRLEEACQHLQQALILKPDSLEIRFNLANALLRQGKCEEAAAQFTEVVRVKPEDANAHYGLGLALAGLGKNDEAAAQFAEALRINPAYADAAKQLESLPKP